VSIVAQMEAYLEEHCARSLNTANGYSSALGRFQEFLMERGIDLEGSVDQLDLSFLRDFTTWLGRQTYRPNRRAPERQLSMHTRHTYVVAVAGFFRFLVVDGKLPGVTYSAYLAAKEHVNRATRFHQKPMEKRLPPEEVVEAVVEAVRQPPDTSNMRPRHKRRARLVWLRNRAMILTLYSTGMRVGEIRTLARDDLEYGDRGAWITGKGDKVRFVRFSHEAWDAIMKYLEVRKDETLPGTLGDRPVFARHDCGAGDYNTLPLSDVSIERVITTLAKDAGVLARFNLTPHSFRHYFATKFLRHTGDLALTQDVMGHASPQTTRLYAKTTKEQHIAAHDSLFDE
jgi:site-specific recombinase XerD